MKRTQSFVSITKEGTEETADIIKEIGAYLERKKIVTIDCDFLGIPYILVCTNKYSGALFVEYKQSQVAVVNILNGKRTPWGHSRGVRKYIVPTLIRIG